MLNRSTCIQTWSSLTKNHVPQPSEPLEDFDLLGLRGGPPGLPAAHAHSFQVGIDFQEPLYHREVALERSQMQRGPASKAQAVGAVGTPTNTEKNVHLKSCQNVSLLLALTASTCSGFWLSDCYLFLTKSQLALTVFQQMPVDRSFLRPWPSSSVASMSMPSPSARCNSSTSPLMAARCSADWPATI